MENILCATSPIALTGSSYVSPLFSLILEKEQIKFVWVIRPGPIIASLHIVDLPCLFVGQGPANTVRLKMNMLSYWHNIKDKYVARLEFDMLHV